MSHEKLDSLAQWSPQETPGQLHSRFTPSMLTLCCIHVCESCQYLILLLAFSSVVGSKSDLSKCVLALIIAAPWPRFGHKYSWGSLHDLSSEIRVSVFTWFSHKVPYNVFHCSFERACNPRFSLPLSSIFNLVYQWFFLQPKISKHSQTENSSNVISWFQMILFSESFHFVASKSWSSILCQFYFIHCLIILITFAKFSKVIDC